MNHSILYAYSITDHRSQILHSPVLRHLVGPYLSIERQIVAFDQESSCWLNVERFEAPEGLSLLTEALTIAHNTGERWITVERYRLKGELPRNIPGLTQLSASEPDCPTLRRMTDDAPDGDHSPNDNTL